MPPIEKDFRMIDTTKLRLPLSHKPFGPLVCESDTELGTKRAYRKRKRIEFDHAHQGIHVASREDGERLDFQNSFLAALQGHNVFGPNDLHRIAHVTCMRACEKLGIKATGKQVARALDEAELQELHVAVNYRCHDEKEMNALLRAIAHIVREMHHTTVTTYGQKSVYISRDGAKVVFYNKGAEILANKLHRWCDHGFTGRTTLKRYAANLVRLELRMEKEWLDKKGMTRLKQWNRSTVKQIITDELDSLDLTKPVTWLDPKMCGHLPNALKRYVLATHSGVPIEEAYESRSVRDIKKQLIAAKVHAALGDHSALRISNVATLLSPGRMLVSYPRRMRERGLVALLD
jgi:hypothetical protein